MDWEVPPHVPALQNPEEPTLPGFSPSFPGLAGLQHPHWNPWLLEGVNIRLCQDPAVSPQLAGVDASAGKR